MTLIIRFCHRKPVVPACSVVSRLCREHLCVGKDKHKYLLRLSIYAYERKVFCAYLVSENKTYIVMYRFYFLFYSVSEFSHPPVPTQLNQIKMYLEDPRSFVCCIVAFDLSAAENKARRAYHALSGEAYACQVIPEWIYKRVCEDEIRYNF